MFLQYAIIILIVASFASCVRILIGPSLWDRLLGCSLLCSKIILIIILYSLEHEQSYYLDVSLVIAMLGFVGTTSVSRFLQKKSKTR